LGASQRRVTGAEARVAGRRGSERSRTTQAGGSHTIEAESDAIIEALQVAAMFSAFNRMADAFGVEFTVPAPAAEAARR
jgi:alkylhydroperoxidase family enzyme